MKKHLIYIAAILALSAGVYGAFEISNSYAEPTATPVKPAATAPSSTATATSTTNQQGILCVKPLDIVANPSVYLNKNIKMDATFDKFSTLGLDYKPAMRKSEDYISFLIRRDDVTDHVMPLAEMKLFLTRKVAEKFIDLESGDKINIEGKVFSTAMSDPWIEVTKLTVLSSKKPIKED